MKYSPGKARFWVICFVAALFASAIHGCAPKRVLSSRNVPQPHHETILQGLPFSNSLVIPHSSFADTEKILRFRDGTLLIQANMDIDTDGSPNAEALDPAHGQPRTSLRYPGVSGQRKYVDSEQVPYFVLPQDFAQSHGLELGDIAAIIYQQRVVYAIFADIGPANKLGEGSIKLAELLGHSPWQTWANGESFSTHGSIHQREVFYIVFPKSRPDDLAPETIRETIDKVGAEFFKFIGGRIPDVDFIS